MLDYLDKMMILEEILPFLTDIQCSDADIIMTVVGSFVFFSLYLSFAACVRVCHSDAPMGKMADYIGFFIKWVFRIGC